MGTRQPLQAELTQTACTLGVRQSVKGRSPGGRGPRAVTQQTGNWGVHQIEEGRLHMPLARTHIVSDDLRQGQEVIAPMGHSWKEG